MGASLCALLSCSLSPAAASPTPRPPFRGPAADSRLGELLVDALPAAFRAGYALDLHGLVALCGATWRPRASQSVLRSALLRQAPWLAAARAAPWDASTRTTQLMRAAAGGHVRRVRELIAAGAKLDLVDDEGFSALQWACETGNERVVEELLVWGANINGRDVGGRTALARAAWHGHEGAVRVLLAHGAMQDAQDARGNTALREAAVAQVLLAMRHRDLSIGSRSSLTFSLSHARAGTTRASSSSSARRLARSPR